MKKYICIGALIAGLIVMLIPVYGNQRYPDLPAWHWAFDFVEDLSDRGLINGYPDGSFKPDSEITCGEFIKMLYISQTGKSLDQPRESWALNYYREGLRMGLYTDEEVAVSELYEVIPRKNMALMTGNIIASNGLAGKVDAENVIESISDVFRSTDHAYEIALSYDTGILTGYTDGSFRPENSLTRAEAVTVIFRLMETVPADYIKDVILIGRDKVKNRDFSVTSYEVSPGYRGITGFDYVEDTDIIEVYSDRAQYLALFIDGSLCAQILNEDGEYWRDDGVYVYRFFAGGLYRQGSRIGLSFGNYIEEVYYYV